MGSSSPSPSSLSLVTRVVVVMAMSSLLFLLSASSSSLGKLMLDLKLVKGGRGTADADVKVEEVSSDMVDVAGLLSGAADGAGWTMPIPNFLRNGLLELREAMAGWLGL